MRRPTIPSSPYTFRFFGKDLGVPWLHTLIICDYRSAKHGVWHLHDYPELVCRLKGELSYDFKGREPLTLHQGRALLIPPGTNHRLADEIDAPGLRICLLLANDIRKFPAGTVPTLSVYHQLRRLLMERALVPFSIPAPLHERMNFLTKLVGTGNPMEDSLSSSWIRLIVTDILMTLATTSGSSRPPHSQLIDKAKDYLASRLSEKVRLRELLSYIGYGQSQFFRLFRSNTGLTPNEWLCRKRIARACELLCETAHNIREIAARTGFSDATYFCRVFKHHIGQTPLAYRTSHVQ